MAWQNLATAKLEAINGSIPDKWRISTIPSVQEQRDVTGASISIHLSKREIEITETDAVGIAAKTTTGQWSAEEVTTAFCHRAGLAHQLVRAVCLNQELERYADQTLDQLPP